MLLSDLVYRPECPGTSPARVSLETRVSLESPDNLEPTNSRDREAAVEERRVSADALAQIRDLRSTRVTELRVTRGLKIDSRATYLIEDKELSSLLKNIRSVLKHNSFASLKLSFDELDLVICDVANVCDDIDDYLRGDVRPRDINKLNTKERRINVLYDKLLKWREYKGIVRGKCPYLGIPSWKRHAHI